jgi:hypothetical protein
MNFKDSFYGLFESVLNETGLKKTSYSNKEALIDRFKDSSQISKEVDLETQHINYNPFATYTSNQFTDGYINSNSYNDMVRKWRQSAMLPEIDEAITEISTEAIVYDEIDDAIVINLDNIELSEAIKEKIRDSFHKILFLLDFNEKGDELFRQWYIDATLTLECVYNNRKPKDGIQKLILLPPFNIFKFKNENSSEIRWFINKEATYNMVKDLENAEITYYDEQITQISSGVYSPDKRQYYSHLQKAMKAINQLYLLEDCLIIYRLTKSPEKRVFYIDTGNLPKSKAEEYIRSLITKYRQKKIYNTDTGTIDNSNKSISVLEDFWFARNAQGQGTKVETLQGVSSNFSGFDDVEYFVTKVFTALNVPNNRRKGDSRLTVTNTMDIEKEEIKFFKFIQKLRRRFNNIFVDLLKKDLIAKQVMTIEDWNKIQEHIKFKYANTNEISAIKKNQIFEMKINTASLASQLIADGMLSKAWVQRNILQLTDSEIIDINNDITNVQSQQTDTEGNVVNQGGGAPEGYEEMGAEGEETTPEGEAPPEAPERRFQQPAQESIDKLPVLNESKYTLFMREHDIRDEQ